ncbi:TRIC cation channel family protein [Rhodococcus aerolatus]
MLQDVFALAGIAAFAASGSLAAVRAQLDLFGICVLGTLTALGGGVLRDVLLGVTPPVSLVYWPNPAVALALSFLAFVAQPGLVKLRPAILVLDTIGMGLFATQGAATALTLGAGGLAAVVVGTLTAIGGGVLRDVLLNQVPEVLRREIYALAALLGAVVVVAGEALGLRLDVATLVGAAVAIALRTVAVLRDWNFPTPKLR